MAGSSGDRHADRGAAPVLSLRQLAAVAPSFDQALDELIARAHDTERAVGDDDVIASEPAGAAFLDATTDSLTDPFATDPYFDPARSDASLDATTDPYGDPARGQRRGARGDGEDGEDQAAAYQLALRGQLAGLQRRVAVAEAHEPVLRDQVADLQRRLAAAEARQSTPRSQRRIWLTVALAFAAGLAARFIVARFTDDRPVSPPPDDPAWDEVPAAARSSEPIVTPIEPPPVTDPSPKSDSLSPGTATRTGAAATGSTDTGPAAPALRKTDARPASVPTATSSKNSRPGSDPAGAVRSPASGGLVDPFAGPSGGAADDAAGSGSANHSPPPAPAMAPAEDAPRDAGAIVDPFGKG